MDTLNVSLLKISAYSSSISSEQSFFPRFGCTPKKNVTFAKMVLISTVNLQLFSVSF